MKKLTDTRPPAPTVDFLDVRGVVLRVDHGDALRQRRFVERDRVVSSRSGTPTAPLPFGIGRDFLLTARTVDDQHDAFERLTVELDVAADAVRVVFVRERGGRRQHTGEERSHHDETGGRHAGEARQR